MMNATIKQLIILLLMTATLAMVLALLPENPAGSDTSQTATALASSMAE